MFSDENEADEGNDIASQLDSDSDEDMDSEGNEDISEDMSSEEVRAHADDMFNDATNGEDDSYEGSDDIDVIDVEGGPYESDLDIDLSDYGIEESDWESGLSELSLGRRRRGC